MRWQLGLAERPAAADLRELDARVRRRGTCLVPDGMALPRDDHVVARPGEEPQGNLVGHRSGRQPEGRLLAEEAGDPRLQPVRCRVLAELVVTDLGRRHRGAHPWRGSSDRVGAEIDLVHGRSLPRRVDVASTPRHDRVEAPGAAAPQRRLRVGQARGAARAERPSRSRSPMLVGRASRPRSRRGSNSFVSLRAVSAMASSRSRNASIVVGSGSLRWRLNMSPRMSSMVRRRNPDEWVAGVDHWYSPRSCQRRDRSLA